MQESELFYKNCLYHFFNLIKNVSIKIFQNFNLNKSLNKNLILPISRYTGAIDVWSVGCIFAELLGRRILFQAHGPIEQLNQIVALLGTPPLEAMKSACDGAKNHVLRGAYRPPDPNRLSRQFPSAGPDAIYLLQDMLQFDPVSFFLSNFCFIL